MNVWSSQIDKWRFEGVVVSCLAVQLPTDFHRFVSATIISFYVVRNSFRWRAGGWGYLAHGGLSGLSR